MDQTTRMLSDLSNAVLMVAQTRRRVLGGARTDSHVPRRGQTTAIRLRLVMNRYKKIPGFTEDEIEKVTSCKISGRFRTITS